MSFLQVGNCPKCSAPLWVPIHWHAVTPPPVTYSCSCNGIPGTVTITSNTTSLSYAKEVDQVRELRKELNDRMEKVEVLMGKCFKMIEKILETEVPEKVVLKG